MRARLVRMEPGYRGRQRIVIEIAGDFREQFDQLQGALLEVQITRAIPRRSLASNNYFHALVRNQKRFGGRVRNAVSG